MIPFLINLIVLLIIFGIIRWIIDVLPVIAPSFRNIAKAVIGPVLILILLGSLYGYTPLPAAGSPCLLAGCSFEPVASATTATAESALGWAARDDPVAAPTANFRVLAASSALGEARN